MNIFRRLPLNRLLMLCAAAIVIAISITALASALSSGPVPPAKPLAQAIRQALTAPSVEGVTANIQFTDHLLEGANLASGGGGATGGLTSSPLVTGASGRLWLAKDGKVRVELQAEGGDTEIVYDGHTVTMYDAATNTLYRYTPPAQSTGQTPSPPTQGTPAAPTVPQIEEAIAHAQKHANVSGATPTDVAGHAAYTVRVAPNETGSLLGGAELSFDAVTGAPLRAAIYSSTTSTPAIELAATSVSYGPVADSVFELSPPADAKVQEIKPTSFAHHANSAGHHAAGAGNSPNTKFTSHGHGLTAVGVLEDRSAAGEKGSSTELLAGLPSVNIGTLKASELRTELGTILSFESGGVRYVLAGAVDPTPLEELARGL